MVQNGRSTSLFGQYDEVGDVIHSQQITGSQTFQPFTYSYNKLGSLQSMTYPSGRTLDMVFDQAGRIFGVVNPNGFIYVNGVNYAATDAISFLRVRSASTV